MRRVPSCSPTLLVDVTNDMRVAQEEIFGPVAVVIKFETEDEVVAMANASEYGLGGAVWTRDINRALRVARAVRTGRMWVNTYNELPAHTPFGGYKKSGIGRETHKMMLAHYTQAKKHLHLALGSKARLLLTIIRYFVLEEPSAASILPTAHFNEACGWLPAAAMN